jgi:hypothetical protein
LKENEDFKVEKAIVYIVEGKSPSGLEIIAMLGVLKYSFPGDVK